MDSKRDIREGARAPSQRQLRAGELIRHALSEVLLREEIHHNDLSGVTVTVSEVSISPDLRKATCFIMPLGGKNTDIVLLALRQIVPWLTGQVARRVQLKFVPKLHIEIDKSFDNADHISRLLRRGDIAMDLLHNRPLEPDNGENGS